LHNTAKFNSNRTADGGKNDVISIFKMAAVSRVEFALR